jgi:DNA gyrase subunit B
VGEDGGLWRNTTHDWASTVDRDHLELVRQAPTVFAPSGVVHLVLEVLAYAADEAEAVGGTGSCLVTLLSDGSVSVADDGRGTDTRHDASGQPVKKPVMATRDLRFFDCGDPPLLPDGHARRGISTVAALSTWLVHTNHRRNGSWTQRYENGIPVTGLTPVAGQGATGTTVRFQPAAMVGPGLAVSASVLERAKITWPHLRIEVVHEGAHEGGRCADAIPATMTLGNGIPVICDGSVGN